VTKSRGPGTRQALGGSGKTKSRASNGGPGRPIHVLQKGPEKWYMAMTRLYSSCSFGQFMIGHISVVGLAQRAQGNSGRDPGKCNRAKLAIG
jgi:hypothetical protein